MPNSKKKIPIQIVNAPSGCGYTNAARAERMIRRGQAESFRDERGIQRLRLLSPSEGRAALVAAAVRRTIEVEYDRASGTGIATEQQAANVPMIRVGKAFGRGGKERTRWSTF